MSDTSVHKGVCNGDQITMLTVHNCFVCTHFVDNAKLHNWFVPGVTSQLT